MTNFMSKCELWYFRRYFFTIVYSRHNTCIQAFTHSFTPLCKLLKPLTKSTWSSCNVKGGHVNETFVGLGFDRYLTMRLIWHFKTIFPEFILVRMKKSCLNTCLEPTSTKQWELSFLYKGNNSVSMAISETYCINLSTLGV